MTIISVVESMVISSFHLIVFLFTIQQTLSPVCHRINNLYLTSPETDLPFP